MTASIETELRAALAHLRCARDALPRTGELAVRDVVAREIASAETSVGRVLHLIAGPPAKEPSQWTP